MPDWEAAYLDGRTAARRRAGVHITRTGLDVTLPETGTRFFWPFREIRQTQGTYAGEQVRLERGGELAEALLIGDLGFLSAARAVSPEATHFHDPARRRFRVGLTFGALVAAVALAVGIYYIGIPAFAAVAAARVPVSWEDKLGSAIVEHFAPPAQRCDDPARRARIDGIVAALTAKARPQPYTFRVTVVNSSIVNAVAAPVGHVSGVVAYGLEGARTLGDLQMSRAAESEADHDGMRLLQEAGIDTQGMITFFEKLSSHERGRGNDSLTRYLRTHPTTAERISTLRALAATTPKPERRLLPDDDWNDIRRVCEGLPAPVRSPRR